MIPDIDFSDTMAVFGEVADEMDIAALRILGFVCVAAIGRKLRAKDYAGAGEDAALLSATVQKLSAKAR